MINFTHITRGVKLLMVFTLSILGNWTAFFDSEKSPHANSHYAYAAGLDGWRIEVRNVDLLGNEEYNIHGIGYVLANRGGESKHIETHIACLVVTDTDEQNRYLVHVIFRDAERMQRNAATLSEISPCNLGLSVPLSTKPISQTGTVFISFDGANKNPVEAKYSVHYKIITVSYHKDDLFALLGDNRDKDMKFSFPVDADGGADRIDIVFNPRNLSHVLSKIEK